jgi:hypothetical protein
MWDTPDKDDEFVRWVDATMGALAPHSLRNGYVNLSVDRGAEWLRDLYGSREKWRRLVALKKAFDPENRLRYNKNIALAEGRLQRGGVLDVGCALKGRLSQWSGFCVRLVRHVVEALRFVKLGRV